MPPQDRKQIENKCSVLLSAEENQLIARMLGSRCKTLATTVVQLYNTQAPLHTQWIKIDTGVLCFVRDNVRKNYFFRIFCFRRNAMIWEHEIYNNMIYAQTCHFLHTFEGEDCMVAFNFANEEEADDLLKIVTEKIENKRKRENRLAEQNNLTNYMNQPMVNKNTISKPMIRDAAAKKAKRKRNITKADISSPSEFRHVSHIGWDKDKGFDVNTEDVHLQEFFQKAGVSEKHLQDRATREFIYDFIQQNGGRDAVEQNIKKKKPVLPPPSSSQSGPPVPPRSTPRTPHNRAAPPPPGGGQPPPRPPPQTVRNACIPPPPPGNAPPPPPPPNGNVAAPPPPPPLPFLAGSSPPVNVSDNTQTDIRSALMNSIREGTSLKPVEVVERKNSDVGRDDMLLEIKKGVSLKPVTEREIKSPTPNSEATLDLADALKRALEGRSRAIHSEDEDNSDTDSNSNDDEWDV